MILTGCMVLLLCGSFCAAFFLPDGKSAGASVQHPQLGVSAGGTVLYGGVTLGGTAEVTGEGISRQYSAAEDVRTLMEIFEKVEICDNSTLPSESEESTHGIDGYTITVTDSEGVQTEYLLQKGLLTNCTTKKTFSVPEVELSKLKQLLGISDD